MDADRTGEQVDGAEKTKREADDDQDGALAVKMSRTSKRRKMNRDVDWASDEADHHAAAAADDYDDDSDDDDDDDDDGGGGGGRRSVSKIASPKMTVKLQQLSSSSKTGGKVVQVSLVHELLLWTLGPGSEPMVPSPKWVLVENRAAIPTVLVVVVDGLSMRNVDRWHHSWKPLVKRAQGRMPMRLDVERSDPDAALRLLAGVRPEVLGERGRPLAAAAAAAAAAAPEDGEKGLPPASFYCLSVQQLEENLYVVPGSEAAVSGGYVTTSEAGGEQQHLPMVAIDCEMVMTEFGLELARLTLLDEGGTVLVDEVVKTQHPVTDYVTQFSGITAEIMERATADHAQARELFLRYVGRDTILVGHSVENDLRVLRVAHGRVIDTAVIYPHTRNAQFKSSLKYLARKFLGRDIQAQASGHCSAEDASAALELAKLKISKGPQFGGAGPQTVEGTLSPLFPLLEGAGRRCVLVDRREGHAALGRFVPSGAGALRTVSSDDESVVLAAAELGAASASLVWCRLWDLGRALDSDNAAAIEAQAAAATARRVMALLGACPAGAMFVLVSGVPPAGRVRRLLVEQQRSRERGAAAEFEKLHQADLSAALSAFPEGGALFGIV